MPVMTSTLVAEVPEDESAAGEFCPAAHSKLLKAQHRNHTPTRNDALIGFS